MVYLFFLINASVQGVNRLFVLLSENNEDRTVHTKYYHPLVEINNCNVMISVRNYFDQPVKNNLKTYDNNRKIAIGQGDEYTIGCLFDYNYFNNYKQIISADLSKQQELDADPKAIQQINFKGNLNRGENVNDNKKEIKIKTQSNKIGLSGGFFVDL